VIKAVIWSPNTERVCGVPLVERTLRALKQAGIREAYFSSWTLPFDDFEGIAVGPFSSLDVSDGEAALLLMGDRLFDPRLISEMARRQVPTLLLDDSGGRIRLAQNGNGHWSVSDAKDALAWVGIASLDNAALARLACRLRNDNDTTLVDHLLDGQAFEALMVNEVDPYIPKLRRELRPYWAELATLTDRRRAASYLMDSGQKDPSDFMARFVHNPIENWVVARLSSTSVTPHQVTIAVNVVAYAVTALFASGHLLLASGLSFVVGLMDGFDGKLARVKGMTTRVGAMEHSFDLLFEFSWLVALGYHLSQSHGSTAILLAAMTIVLTAFYRDIYTRFGTLTGRSLDIHGRFELFFRRVAGRRNLYNVEILFFVLLGVPFYALVTMCIHATMTSVVYGWRSLLHLSAMDGTPDTLA
jgi:phosphatidylglycerophosphate synthase